MLSACKQTLFILRLQAISGCCHQPSVLPYLQCVRWKKRRWAPLNRSKEFYVRKPTPIDREEWAELKKRTDIYNTSLRAITKYFKQTLKAAGEAAVSTHVVEEQEREFEQLLLENDRWNAVTGKIREARQAQEDAAAEEERLQKLIDIEQQKTLQQQASEIIVQQEMENAKNFINMDDLDAELEKVLNMRVSYNFAIDKDGNRYIEMPDGSTTVEKQSDVKQIFHASELSEESSKVKL